MNLKKTALTALGATVMVAGAMGAASAQFVSSGVGGAGTNTGETVWSGTFTGNPAGTTPSNGSFTATSTGVAANNVSPYSGPPVPYHAALLGSSWISLGGTQANGTAISQPTPGLDYLFQTSFVVSSLATAYNITGSFLSDNNVVDAYMTLAAFTGGTTGPANHLYLNPNGSQDQNGSTTFSTVANLSGLYPGGGPSGPQTVYLDFIVHNQTVNNGYNPVALDFVATAAVPEPGTYAAFLIGGLGVMGLMIGARKRTGSTLA